MLFLGACGDDGGQLTQPTPDGGELAVDAPITSSVTLAVARHGAPVSGVTVYFQNADSTLVSRATTDASGVASAEMAPGGYVTAVDAFPEPGTSTLSSFAGAKPGDHFVLDLVRGSGADLGSPINVNLEIDEDPNRDTDHYDVSSTCGYVSGVPVGTSANPYPASFDGCTGGVADLVVVSKDVNDHALASFSMAAVALSDGATAHLAGAYAPLTVTAFAYKNVVGVDFSSLDVKYQQLTSHGLIAQAQPTTRVPVVVNGDIISANAVVSYAPAASSTHPIGIEHVNPWGETGHTWHSIVRWDAVSTSHPSMDVQASILREFGSVARFDLSANAITWTAGTTGFVPDLVVAQLFVMTPTHQSLHWALSGPYAGGEVRFPVLPADAATLHPTAADTTQVSRLMTVKTAGGYDGIHERGLNVTATDYANIVTGAAGVAAFTEYYANGEF